MVRRYIALGLVLGFLGACAHRADKVETVFYPMPPEQPRLQFLTSLTGRHARGTRAGARGPDETQVGRVTGEEAN